MFSLLYIDDEPGLLELGQLFLERTGEFTVTTALSADAGLACLAQHDFDAVISDYQMPGMDGISLLKNVRKSYGNIPFVLFTGRGREEVVIEAINNGVDFYLQKGGDPKAQFAELAHKVRQAVNRRQAETALSDSEKRLADIINFLPDATFAIDTQGVVIAWNRAMERMTGVSSSEILGKGNFVYAIPFYQERRPLLINLVLDDDPALPAKYPFVKKEGRTLISEITIPHFNDGRGAALWFTASPLYNRNGDVVGAIESIREVTERKQAEEDLVSANREYTNLLDQIQDVYYRSDTEGRLVKASRSWATLFGYDDISECLGRSIADDFYVNPSDRKQLLDEIYRNGKVSGYEVLLKKKDGTPVLVEASSHLYYDPEGIVIGIEGTFRDITERKRADAKLREAYSQITANEEKFRSIVETTPEIIWEVDLQGKFRYVSPRIEAVMGYLPEEIIGRSIIDLVSEEVKPFLQRELPRYASSTKPPLPLEVPARHRDGHELFLEIRPALAGADGSVAGFRGVAVDITERKRAEKALKTSEKRFRELAELLPQGIYEADAEGILTYANPRALEMFRHTEEDIKKGLNIRSTIAHKDRQRVETAFGQIAEQRIQPMESTEYLALRKDGTTFPIAIFSSPITRDGRVTGVRGILIDITERKEAEDALTESERRFRELADLLPQGIYEADITGRLTYANRIAQEMSGYTQEDLRKGLNAMTVFAPEDRQRAAAIFSRIVEHGTRSPENTEYEALRKDGTTFPVSIFSSPIIRDGKIVGMRGIIIDITERKRTEEELHAVNEQLVASEEELRAQYDELAESEKRIRMSETRLTFMLGFYEYSQKSEKELLEYAIEGAGIVTGSPLGYLAFLNEDESQLSMYAWSKTAMAECSTQEKPIVYETKKTGLWGEAVRQRQPVITNDYAAPNPAKKGYPEGHPRIIRHMNVPVLDEGRIVLVAGVANKPSDYTEKDASELLLLMQGLWTIIKRKRLQEEQKAAFEQISASEEELREQYEELAVTQEDLQKHKLQLEEIAGTLPGVIYQFYARPDGSMGLYYVSSRAADVFGISSNPEDFFERFTQHIDPRDRQAFLQSNMDVARNALPWHYEGRFVKPSGDQIWFEGISRPIRRDHELVFNGVLLDITARKRAEEALFNSQQMLQAVLDSIPQRVFWKDTNSVFLGCNKPLALDAGFSEPADMIGKTDYDHASHETADLYRADDRQVMETGQPRINYEEPQIRSDGSHAWLRTTKVPLRNKEGTIIGVLGTYEDITERKRAEEAVRESEEKYRSLVENIPFGITLIDADHRIIMSNAAQGQMFHTDAGLWAGRYCYREFEKRDAVCMHCPGTKAMATGICHEVETEGVRDDGTRFNARVHAIPLPDDEGRATRFIEVVEDITERKMAEDALRQNEEKYRTLIETTGTGFVIIDQDGRVLDANPEYVRMTGHADIADVKGRNVTEWTAEHDRARNADAVRQCIRDGFIRNFEIDYADNAGKSIPIEINATVLGSGDRMQIHTLCRDITQRKRAEEELRERSEEYQKILQTAMDGFCIVAMDGSFIDANDAFCKSVGYTREEVLTLSLPHIEVRENPDETARHMKDIISKGRNRFETRFRQKDGGIIDVEVSVVYTGIHGGRFITFSRDITRRKKETEEIRLLKISADRSSDEVFWLDFTGQILYVNDAACRITGYSRDDLLKMKIFELDPDFPPEVWNASVADLRERKTQFITTRHRRKDGVIIDVEIVAVYVSQDDQEYSFAYVRDITDRRLAENQVRESEQNHRLLFETATEGILVAQGDRMVNVNSALVSLLGRPVEDITSRPFTDFIHPDDRELVMSRHLQRMRGEIPPTGYEFRIITRDNQEKWVMINSTRTEWSGQPASLSFLTDITERKVAEERLVTANKEYTNLLDQIQDVYYRTDTEGRLVKASRSFATLLGYDDIEECLGRNIAEDFYVNPMDRNRLLEEIDQKGKVTDYEVYLRKKDGTPVLISTNSHVNTDATGRIIGIEGTFRDITERKQTETAIFESERKYRTLFETADEGIWTIDAEFRTTSANRKMQEMFGYTEQEMMGRPVWDFVPPEDAESVKQELFKRPKGIPGRYERRWVKKDGTIVWCFTSATPLFSADGTFAGSFGMFTDITERKQMEESLRESEAKFRAVINQSFEFIGLMSTDGMLIVANRSALEFAGIAESDVINRPFWETPWWVHSEELRERLKDAVRRAAAGETVRFEATHPGSNGHIATIDFSLKPVVDPTGKILYLIPEGRDITERKRAEEALRESEEKYRMLVESSFNGIAIHQDEILVYVNRTAARLLGSDDPDVFIGRPAIGLVAPAYRERIMERIREAPEKPLKLIHEQFQRLDGTLIDVDVTSTPGTWKGRPAAFVTFRDITEQKRAEVALRESESRWRQWIEQSPIPIGLYRLDGTGIYSNVHFVRIIGYTLDEIPDMETYWRTMFPDPQYRQEIKMAWEDRVKTSIVHGGYIEPLEARILCRDGVTRTLEFTGLVIGDTILVTYYDLTTRKKAEEALHESEEKYRTLVEVNRDIIYSLDTDGTILYTSPQITAKLGYTPDEVEGHNFSEIVHPDDIGSLVSHIQENFITGKPVAQDQFRLRRKDGTYRWYEDKSIYATDSRGRHIVSGTIRDITEEKAAQDALRESEEKFRALVETTSDFIWEVDAAGVYTYVSPQVYQILGYEPDEMVGRTPFDFMLPEEIEKVTAEFNHCIASRRPIVALENKAIRKDRSVVVLETSGVVRTANDGSYHGYRGIDRDITTRKIAAERTTRLSALKQDLLRAAPLDEKLKQITDGIVEIFGADFARIWMTGPGDLCDKGCIHAAVTKGLHICRNRKSCLHLIASSGRYTHTDGDHRRVPFGAYKIGRLATGEEAHFITNDVTHDPRVHDHAWAESLGLVSFSGFQLVSPGGEPIGVLAFFSREPITQDIVDDLDDMATTTSQVIQTGMAEEAQREREEWARTILNTAQTGIVLIDAETHRILDANPKALGMIGLPRDSVIGRVCHYFICPAEKGNCPVTDGGQDVDTSERILVTSSETMIPVLKTVVSVTLGGRKVLVESFVDISEQKRSEAAIREANRKLNLLSTITRHDVTNQLTVIQGYTQLAALSKPEPVIADFLAKIESGIDTIQRQIEFSRTYQDLGVQAPSWFVIGDVIRSIGHEGIKLVCTCKTYEIYADPMISRVFYNLFDNAARYGERVTTVRVGCAKKGKKLVIRFADNGVGIPSTEKKKIFLKGYGKHTGFGLFLAREILAITGIIIQETGTYGKGAIFEITVPEGSFRKAD